MAQPVYSAIPVSKDTGWFEFLVDVELGDVFDFASVAELGCHCHRFSLEYRQFGPFFEQISCLHLGELILAQDMHEALWNLPDLP